MSNLFSDVRKWVLEDLRNKPAKEWKYDGLSMYTTKLGNIGVQVDIDAIHIDYGDIRFSIFDDAAEKLYRHIKRGEKKHA